MTITVATNNARIRYTATSGQTAFAIPFEFFENDEIYVYVAATTLVAADEKTQGTGSTHYAVSGGGGSTGTVTFVTGITESYIVTIVRDIPIERITDFTAGSTINRAALNTQLDTLTAMVGDLKDKSDRAIRLQPYDSEISLFLPTIANRAGKIFGFDTNGNLTADTAANFDITLDDVVTNTLTMSGNANSKINLTAVLDSQILTNGAVLNIKSTKGSNTADIKLDGSTTYGIDLNAGNKAIRLQDATLFSSTIESSGAATLSSVVTSTITSTADIDLKPSGGQVNVLGTSGEQRILFDNAASATMQYFQNSNITKLGVVDPTGTRTLLLPDESGTIHSSGGTTTHSNITVSSDGKVQFRDAAIYIQSGADGHLDLVADTEIHIAATTVNVDGLMDISGNLSVGGNFDVTGTIDFSDSNITNVGLISLDKITNDGAAGITLDSSVGIVLDAGSGQIVFKDDNTTRLTVAVNSGSTQSITSAAGFKLNSGTDITLEADGGQVYITDPSGNDNFQFNGAASPTLGIHQNSNVTNLGLVDPTATRTILFPDASDTLVGKATTDTLTNKTLTAPTLTGTTVVASLDISGDIDVDGTTNLDVVDIDGAVDMASTLGVAGVVTANAGVVVDNFTLDGTSLSLSSGVMTLNAADVRIKNVANNETMAQFDDDGAVNLYNNNELSLSTVAGGSVGIYNDLSLTSDGAIINIGAGNDLKITHDGTNGDFESAGHLTFDVVGDIILDSDSANWRFKDDGTSILEIGSVSSGPSFYSAQSNAAMLFKGNDGGSPITALTLDMGNAGTATFNRKIIVSAADGVADADYVGSFKNLESTGARSFGVSIQAGTTASDIALNVINTAADTALLRVKGNGAVSVGNTLTIDDGELFFANGHGVSFAAHPHESGMTSEILNDYEEGTWTPVINGTTTTGSGTYSNQSATYTKIGRTVVFEFAITWTNHTGAGSLEVGGFPYGAGSQTYYTIQLEQVTLTSNNIAPAARIESSGSVSLLIQSPVGGGNRAAIAMDTTGSINGGGTYQV